MFLLRRLVHRGMSSQDDQISQGDDIDGKETRDLFRSPGGDFRVRMFGVPVSLRVRRRLPAKRPGAKLQGRVENGSALPRS